MTSKREKENHIDLYCFVCFERRKKNTEVLMRMNEHRGTGVRGVNHDLMPGEGGGQRGESEELHSSCKYLTNQLFLIKRCIS